MFDTNSYQDKINHALSHFEEELKKIRTGRAHASMLEGVKAEVYGTLMPLNQVSNITAAEAQMLTITPFDPSNINAITTAIRNDQSLGLNPSDDGRIIRVPVPALTEERRKQLVKQSSEKGEDVRIVLRNIRQDGLKEAKRKKDAKELGEDDVKRIEKEFDKIMADAQATVEATLKAKEKDILTI